MEVMHLLRSLGIFVVLLATLAFNAQDNLLTRLGFAPDFTYMVPFAIGVTAMIAGRAPLIVGSVVLLSFNANMPSDFVLSFGLDRDYFTGLMMAVLMTPLIRRFVD